MSRVPIERLMAEFGTGKRTTFRLVRERKLPGFIDGRQYMCTEGEFEHWERTGEVLQNIVRSTQPYSKKRKPISIVRNDRNGKAA